MSIQISTPSVADLGEVGATLAQWQVDGAPLQLHPGDLAFHRRLGPEATAAALRVWADDGKMIAVGLLDGAQLLRTALDPALRDDRAMVEQVAADLADPDRGILAAGEAVVEARCGDLLPQTLLDLGWVYDEPWTSLHRDLTDAVDLPDVRVETIGPEQASEWVRVQWSAFRGTAMTEEDVRGALDRWQAMTTGVASDEGRCLLAYDDADAPVAVAAVWSAGPGRPGLLEPVGVHADHRGHGHGRTITLAAAAVLREMGSSSASVCTDSARVAAVATYASAGMVALPQVRDLRRPA